MRVRIVILFGWLSFSTILHAQEAAAGANALAASTSLSGYVSTSYHFGPDGGSDPYALAPANRNAFSLDVVGLSIRRPLDEWLFDTGFRVDLWLGPDAALLGSGASANTMELRQAYIDLRVPIADPRDAGEARSLDLRLGVFDSPLGYESLDRNLNPHYSHSWGFTIEPTLHTGLLAMYPGVDALENGESDYLFSLGVANTIDPRINGVAENVDRKTLLAGLTWLLPESFGPLGDTAFSAGYVNGRARTGAEPIQNLYLALGLPLRSDDWSLGLVYDARILGGAGNDDSVFGAYLGHRLNDKLSLNLRGELFRDGDKLFSSIVLFPQGARALSPAADGITFMMLMNSTSPRFLIEEQTEGAPYIKEAGIETLPMGYIICAPGGRAGQVGQASLIEAEDEQRVRAYAMAAESYGFRMFYLEAGSGASYPVGQNLIRSAREACDLTLVVGGGIRDGKTARLAAEAGADWIITGNLSEEFDDADELQRVLSQFIIQMNGG